MADQRIHEGQNLHTVVLGEGDQETRFEVVACVNCGFIHVLPVPTEDQALALYEEEYYGTTKPNYLAESEEDRGWLELVNNERVSLLEQQLPMRTGDQYRLLDIGSGPGLLLHEARRRGWWDCYGVEPSSQAASYSRNTYGLTDIHNGPFNAEFSVNHYGFFHAVTATEVLEHVPDPLSVLQRVNDVMVPGGVLLLVVPNDYNVLQLALWDRRQHVDRAWWLAPPHHLNYFKVRSLDTLVRRAGFVPSDITCTFPMELFLFMGMNYVGNDDVGRQAHAIRKRMELQMETHGLGDVRREAYRALARKGLGRDLVMVARKSARQPLVG